MTKREIEQLREAADLLRTAIHHADKLKRWEIVAAADNLDELADREERQARRPAPLLGVDT